MDTCLQRKKEDIGAKKRLLIISEVAEACKDFDTWDSATEVGMDLAYLFWAIADTSGVGYVDWSKEWCPHRSQALEDHLLDKLGLDHPVWLFITPGRGEESTNQQNYESKSIK